MAKHRKVQQIPKLVGTGECEDWLNRHHSRPESVRRGEIWVASLRRNTYTSEQEGLRPVLILSNNIGNKNSYVVSAAPMTTKLKRPDLPTHVVLAQWSCGNDAPSMVLFEQTTAIDKKRLTRKIGEVTDPEVLEQINQAVRVQFGV